MLRRESNLRPSLRQRLNLTRERGCFWAPEWTLRYPRRGRWLLAGLL